MVTFSGMKPWREDYDIIEVEVRGQLLDLHNFGTVLSVEYRPPDLMVARFQVDQPRWLLELQFLMVEGLSIERIELSSHDPDQLHGISFQDLRAKGAFSLILRDGLAFSFKAKGVMASADEAPNST